MYVYILSYIIITASIEMLYSVHTLHENETEEFVKIRSIYYFRGVIQNGLGFDFH